MGFAEWLKEQMHYRRLNQPQLAQAIGVNQSTISYWLRNRSTPEAHTVPRIAKALGVEPNTIYELLGFESNIDQPYEFKVIGPLVEEIDRILASVDDPQDRALIEERLKHDVRAAIDMLEALNQRRQQKEES